MSLYELYIQLGEARLGGNLKLYHQLMDKIDAIDHLTTIPKSKVHCHNKVHSNFYKYYIDKPKTQESICNPLRHDESLVVNASRSSQHNESYQPQDILHQVRRLEQRIIVLESRMRSVTL